MINTIKNCNPLIMFSLGAILAVVLALFLRGANPAYGTSPGDTQLRHATSTQVLIAADTAPTTPVAATSTCAARIVSTFGSAIRIGFRDATISYSSTRPNGHRGFVQAASTTVVYGAQDYGCDAFFIYSYSAATTTITETF